MVERLFDYLTLSCLTTKNISVEDCLDRVLNVLQLSSLWHKFDLVGRSRFYSMVYRYNDISIKICDPERLASQGICVEFSGNGLAFYQSHLTDKGLDLRRIFKTWRSFSVGGYFTRATRIDYTMDEIRFNDDTPWLNMKRINSCVKKHEFRSRLALCNPKKKLVVEFNDFSRKEKDLGSTVYFGNRRSAVYCRFYDKLLEQQHRKAEVDENITSWVRCELEFKQARAMAVFNAYCDMTDKEFAEYMSGVVNNYISFINLDDGNISRCSLKTWWAEFLGYSGKSRLTIPPYKPSSFQGTSGWLLRSVFPTLCRYILCVGFPAFFRQLSNAFNELETAKTTHRHKQMMNDFKTVMQEWRKPKPASAKSGYEEYTERVKRLALDPWLFTSSDPDKALEQLQEDYDRYINQKGNEWDFAVLSDSYTSHIQLNYNDFPPESIYGADFHDAYYDDGVDDFIMDYFVNDGCC